MPSSLEETAAHDHPEPPLLAYAGLIVGFHLLLGAVSRRRELGSSALSPGDILLYGVATHKIANVVAKDRVTKAVRAPFVEGDGSEERPTGGGLQRALGQLVTCPICFSPWTALALAGAHTVAPRGTRFAASVFATAAVADFVHHVYQVEERVLAS